MDGASRGTPTQTFASFAGLTIPNNRYFQYRVILESDDSVIANGPELKSVSTAPSHFDGSAPPIMNQTGIPFRALSSFSATLGSSGCPGTARFQLSLDKSTWYSSLGGTWTKNSTYSTANSAEELNSNISTFPTQVGTGKLYIRALLNSNSLTPCQIDSISISGMQ